MPLGEYETVIERFIEGAARWDGSLPVETFFDAWAAFESRKDQVEVQAEGQGRSFGVGRATRIARCECKVIASGSRMVGRW